MIVMPEQQFPEPIVGVLMFNADDNIFLMKSHKCHDTWIVPGGHIELGEKIEHAVKREVKEETNIDVDVSDLQFIGLQEHIFDEAFWKKRHFIFLDYTCKAVSNDVQLNNEAQEYQWVSLKDALKLPLGKYTKRLLETYLNNKNYPSS